MGNGKELVAFECIECPALNKIVRVGRTCKMCRFNHGIIANRVWCKYEKEVKHG